MNGEEFASRLRQLHHRTSALRSLVTQVQTQAKTGATVATDPSGSVRVEVDPDGVPRVIRVEPDWRRRSAPEGLAACVLAAYQTAVEKAARALAGTFGADAWRSGISMAEAGRQDGAARAPSPPSAPMHGRPRDPLALTEEILKALHTARTRATAPTPTYVGHAGRGSLSITLSSSGLHEFSIEPAWAARQNTATLNSALGAALEAARARLSADTSSHRAEADTFDALANEALATLAHVTGSIQRPEGSPG